MTTTALDRSPLLKIPEAASRLRVSEVTVRRLIGRGEIKTVRVGSQLRIPADDLEAWLFSPEPQDAV
jgi:excisionase family DNA binding protein